MNVKASAREAARPLDLRIQENCKMTQNIESTKHAWKEHLPADWR